MFSFDLLQKFSDAFSIPVQVYHQDKLLFSCMEQICSPNPSYYFMSPYIRRQHMICFVISPDYILSGYIQNESSEQYLIIGPVCPYELSADQVKSLLKTLDIPLNRLDSFLRLFHSIPHMDVPSFRNTLVFLNAIFHPESRETPIHVTYRVPLLQLDNILDAVSDFHLTQISENETLKMIEYGKPDEIAAYFDSLPSLNLHSGKLGPNALRSIKNTYIVTAAIASRVALKGGVNYDTVLSLTDYYISKAESLTLFSDIIELMRDTLIDFARRVSLCENLNTDSSTVNAVQKIVEKKLYEKIGSGDIARLLSLERTYLCHHFKEKTGKTLTEYIQERKIREAKYLLKTTSLSLVEISERLAYSSQQQFQTSFKKRTGTTPANFRKENT